jgi:MarR family transcriptional regulator for hemolysin
MRQLIEDLFLSRELYSSFLLPVCEKYDLTQTDLIILLCLDGFPQKDTATDIISMRKLTKSAVSASVRSLQEKGLISGAHLNGNHRSVHLKLQEQAAPIVRDGLAAQEGFFKVLFKGFSKEEIEQFQGYFHRMKDNIRHFEGTNKGGAFKHGMGKAE